MPSLTVLSPLSIQVDWNAPSRPNGVILNYELLRKAKIPCDEMLVTIIFLISITVSLIVKVFVITSYYLGTDPIRLFIYATESHQSLQHQLENAPTLNVAF